MAKQQDNGNNAESYLQPTLKIAGLFTSLSFCSNDELLFMSLRGPFCLPERSGRRLLVGLCL